MHGNHGYPTPRGQRPEEGPGNDGLGRDPPGDTTSRLSGGSKTHKAQRADAHLQLDTDVERERERERESEREREREREGRERQAKRGWHPTIPLGYSAINHQK